MKEGGLCGPSAPVDAPGSGGEEQRSKEDEPKGLGAKFAVKWQQLKSELKV